MTYGNPRRGQRCHAALLLLAALFLATAPLQAQTLTTLYNFTGGADGANPATSLIRDAAGNLYGTTPNAGAGAGYGTIFKIDTANAFSVLYSFTGANDGANPHSSLIMDTAGNFYGTTSLGGASGCGTVFKLDTSNTLSVLHAFNCTSDGGKPYAGLLMDASGNLYGTTAWYGSGYGTVFKIDTSNTFTVLHTFASDTDGGQPLAPLIMDDAGNLYGTAACCGAQNWGTVFKIDPNNNFTVLHTFAADSDGGDPYAALLLDGAGNLYGTAACCGSQTWGTVFKIDSSGHFSLLYSFTGGSDGAGPQGSLVMDAAGNLYGTTDYAGAGYATVFKIDASNNFSTLYSFNGNDGGFPSAGLVLDPAGNAYGTTQVLGSGGSGTVFKLGLPAALTSPSKSSILPPGPVTFTWLPGGGVTSYQLWIGSTPGAADLGYYGTNGSSATIYGLPTGGQQVYLTLWGYNGGNNWSIQDTATFTSGSYAQITSPAKGSTLSGSANFTWSAESSATSYQLWLGTYPGANNLGVLGTSNLQGTISGLPTNGGTVYVTLWGYGLGNWSVQDTATYTAGPVGNALITSPVRGSTLPGSVVTFNWQKLTGATSYQLWLGSSPGAQDLGWAGTILLNQTFTGLPTNGQHVYATLWVLVNNTWTLQDVASYTAANQ